MASTSKGRCSGIDHVSCDDNETGSDSGWAGDKKKIALSKLSLFKRTWTQSTLRSNLVGKKFHSNKNVTKKQTTARKAGCLGSYGNNTGVVKGGKQGICISNNNNEELIACEEKNGLLGLVSDKTVAGFGNSIITGGKNKCNVQEINTLIKPGQGAIVGEVTGGCHKVPAAIVKDFSQESHAKRNKTHTTVINSEVRGQEAIDRFHLEEQTKSNQKLTDSVVGEKYSFHEKSLQTTEFNNAPCEICISGRDTEISGILKCNIHGNNRNSSTDVGPDILTEDKNNTVNYSDTADERVDNFQNKRGNCDPNNSFDAFLSSAFGNTGNLESTHKKPTSFPETDIPTSINERKLQSPRHEKEERELLWSDVTHEKRAHLRLSPGGGASPVSEARAGSTDSVCNYTGQVNACLHETPSPSYPYTCDNTVQVQNKPALLSSGIWAHNKCDSTDVKSDSELLNTHNTEQRNTTRSSVCATLTGKFYNSGQTTIRGYSESNLCASPGRQSKLNSLCSGVNACNGHSLALTQPKLQTTDLRKELNKLPKSCSTNDPKENFKSPSGLNSGKKAEHLVHTAGFIEEIPSSKIQITTCSNTGEWRFERPSSVLETKGHNNQVVPEQTISVLNSTEKKYSVFPGSSETSNSENFVSSQRDKICLYKDKFEVRLDHHNTVSSTLSLASSLSSRNSSIKQLSVSDLDKLVIKRKPTVCHHNVRYNRVKKKWDSVSSVKSGKSLAEMDNPCGSSKDNNTMYSEKFDGRNMKQGSSGPGSSITLNTSHDSGFVPGLAIMKGRLPHGYQSSSSCKYSDSSCLSDRHGHAAQTVKQHISHRPAGSGQSDTSLGADNSSDSKYYTSQSRLNYDLYQQPQYGQKLGLWREYPEMHHSTGSRPVMSLDSESLGSSQASSLCLVTGPEAEASDFVIRQQLHHGVSEGRLPVKGVVLREKRNQRRKSRKNREWGTAENIPEVTENSLQKHKARPKSFGAGEMYQTRRSCDMIDRIESESEDSDSSIDVDNFDDFSMAEDDSQVGGCSLDDKLRLAATKGQVERIPTLLAQGAGFQPDKEGRTAIHYAALSGYSEAVRILSANGCDVNTKDNLGYTALHRSAAQGHAEVVKVLCECGCNLNIQDEVHGNSALHEAAWNGYSRTVDVLCRHKANVHLVNKAGFSALHLAAQNGHNQSGRSLLYANCDPNHKNNYGDTPLHTAGRYGHAGVTRILLSAKCGISEQNKNGDTALHIAAALKRRKIAKLLVESNINISFKNKQNETAADVARRKEHHEITLIITSQAKLHKQKKKEDKKKKKEGKFSGIEESDDPRKDKKMFFFKKRSKSKDIKENKENRDASADRLDGRQGRGVSSSMDAQAGGIVSEVVSNNSSGRGTFTQPSASNARLSRDPQQKSRSTSRERAAKSQGTSTTAAEKRRLHEKKVHGLLTQYEPKQGVQYYRDLAGNIKQGPIGFAPVCNCGPSIKKIEQRLEADRNNLYDHIDATHKMLSHQIEDVDHKCCERVHATTRDCQQQFEEEKRTREAFVNTRVLQERQDTEQMMRFQEHLMRAEYMDYMSHKMGAFEDHYAPMKSNCQGCDHCGPPQHRHHRDDTDLNPTSSGYVAQTPHNGLYRSKSDETLSVSSSKRPWKMKGKPKSVRQMKERHTKAEVHNKVYGKGYESSGTTSRPAPQGEVMSHHMVYHTSTPLHGQEEKLQSSGRTPEGQSSNNEYSEHNSYLDPVVGSHYGTWNARRKPVSATVQPPIDVVTSQDQEKDLVQQDFEKLTVRDYPQSSLSHGHSTSTPVSQASNRPTSGQPEVHHLQNQGMPPSLQGTPDDSSLGPLYSKNDSSYNPAPFNTPVYNTPNYNTPNSSYTNTHNSSSRLTTSGSSSYVLSPDQVQVHHVKTDSGSNPDSGYSSKIYGMRPAVSGRSISTSQGSPNNLPYPVSGTVHHSNNIVPAPLQPKPDIAPLKTVPKNRGYSSDGCPGMRRPKYDAYASDNCGGMRMKKALPQQAPHKSALNDWYEKQVSAKGNGVIKEVPTPPLMQQHVPAPPKSKDFWPGKATQV